MKKLKGQVIGAGYFSDFHLDAWSRIPDVQITAISDFDSCKINSKMEKYGILASYFDYQDMVEQEKPDFVDIITPPASHLTIIEFLAKKGIPMICQKPLAPTYEEAQKIMEIVEKYQVPFMVHENFRFQPWHREIKKLLESGVIGRPHNFYFQSRLGDGHQDNAYLDRQPYFREYKQFLIYETGIHFIDTFRFLGGEISEVYARVKQLNSHIKGEDTANLNFTFENGAWGTWDAGRYNEDVCQNVRFTFGTFLVEGLMGSIRLNLNGEIYLQKLGEKPKKHIYPVEEKGFAGDSCLFTQQHFVNNLIAKKDFETNVQDYLKNLQIQNMAYKSAKENRPLKIN